jgi:hypothetical protein
VTMIFELITILALRPFKSFVQFEPQELELCL